jgi:outer membrane lipoprotein-sorting protein
LASVTIPYSQTQSVSADEILQKAQALSENPLAAKVKSFHLTARSTGKLGPNGDKPLDLTTEQWFVAPDRMRTESKTKASDGSTVISGFVSDGQNFKHYQTSGAGDRDVVTMIGVPAMKAVAVDKPVGAEPSPGGEAREAGVFIARKVEAPDAKPGEGRVQEITKIDVDKDEIVALTRCKESRKQEEATIAGRKAYVVETDFSTCTVEGDPANLPDFKMPGRHVAWIDKETYVPLKMEDYARDGKLTHTYEVTSIEYDVSIADSTFKDIPPQGTELRDIPMIKLPDGDEKPGLRPAPAPALSGTPVPAPKR